MQKVRIGNDISLQVNLTGSKNIDAVNIHSVNAYLINTSKYNDLMHESARERILMDDEIECRKHEVRFVSRFPVEPFVFGHHYCPNPYDICCSGRPCYHTHPMPFVPVYPGFGVHPHTFEPHTWCHDDLHDVYHCAAHMHEHMQHDLGRCSYLAPVESTGSNNVVKVFFPANAQLYTGKYKLVLVVKLYEPGYCKNHFRTVTVDYNDVFELVDAMDFEGEGGEFTINIGSSVAPESIIITGIPDIKQGLYTTLSATVYPMGLVDGSVTWSIADGVGSISLNPSGNSCQVVGIANGDYTVRAESNLNRAIFRDFTVHVTSTGAPQTDTDKYVNNVVFNDKLTDENGQAKSILTIDRTGELPDIVLNTTPYTEWYEGN